MINLAPRFQTLELLGRGGMGEVWRVRCERTDQEVALKVCLSPDETGRLQFRQEFWVMSTLRHPSLIPALEAGETEDGRPFFTMPIVRGTDASPGMPEAQVRAWLPGVLSALDFLHQRGFVHGDIKPENIRLTDDGGVRLMDLGLLRRSGRPAPISGTLAYVPPELVLGRAVDGRSDLYMLGAVLYELLAGVAPFSSARTDALLRAHVSQHPAPLRQVIPAVSLEMDSVVARLLEKNPADRFASGQEVLAALGLESADDESATLWTPPLLGREVLQRDLEAWSVQAAPDPPLRAIQGGAGFGKTRLLEELVAFARLQGEVCVLGAGMGSEATPYQALAPWVSHLWELAAADVRERLGPFLTTVLPHLADQAARSLEGSAERTRFFDSVALLAEHVAPRLTWCLDDVERLDSDSSDLVLFLKKRGETLQWRWLVAGRDLPEKMVESAPVATLAAFSPEQSRGLLATMLGGKVPEAVALQAIALAEGVPGSVELLARHWAQQGILKKRRGQWYVTREGDLVASGGIEGLADSSWTTLESAARSLLDLAAVLGERASLADLAQLSGLDDTAFFAARSALEQAGLLLAEDGAYRFLRPGQMPRILAAWDPSARREQHARIAVFFEARTPLADCVRRRDLGTLLRIAGHWVEAGRLGEAWPWVEAATRLCLTRGTTTTVISLVNAMHTSSDLQPRVLLALAGLEVYILRHQGQLDEAIARYDDGLLDRFVAQSDREAGEHLITYATMVQQKGRYDQAAEKTRLGIERARRVQDWATVVRGQFGLGRMHYFQGDSVQAVAQIEEAIALARQHGLTSSLPPMLSLAGYILSSAGEAEMPRAMALMTEGLKLAREEDNLYDSAEALNNLGNVLMAGGKFSAAKRYFEEYLVLCERMALPGEETFAHLNVASVALELGYLADATYHTDVALKICRPAGRRFPEAFAMVTQGALKIQAGEPDAGLALIQASLDLTREISNRYLESQVLAFQAEAAMLTGQLDWAESLLAQLEADPANSEHSEQAARLARVRAGLDSVRDAAAFLRRAEAAAGSDAPLPGVTLHVLRWGGCAALRGGEAERAERLLRAAAALAEAEQIKGVALEVEILRALAAEAQGAYGRMADRLARATALAEETRATHAQQWIALLRAYMPSGSLSQSQAALGYLHAWRQRLPRESVSAALQLECRDLILAQEATCEMSQRTTGLAAAMCEVSAASTPEDVIRVALGALLTLFTARSVHVATFQGSGLSGLESAGTLVDNEREAILAAAWDVHATGEERLLQLEGQHGHEPSAVLAVPLPAQDRLRVWILHVPQRPDLEPAAVRQAVAFVARMAANKLDLAHAESREGGGSVSASLALQAAKAALDGNDPMERVSALAAETLRAFNARRLLLLAQEGGRMRCEVAFGPDAEVLNPEWQIFTKGLARQVFNEKKPQFFDATEGDGGPTRASVRALDLHYVLVAPLSQGDVTRGVLYLDLEHGVSSEAHALETLEALAGVWAAMSKVIAATALPQT